MPLRRCNPGPVTAILLDRVLALPGMRVAAALDSLAIVASIVLAVGIVALNVMNHMRIEYDMSPRLKTLEGKK